MRSRRNRTLATMWKQLLHLSPRIGCNISSTKLKILRKFLSRTSLNILTKRNTRMMIRRSSGLEVWGTWCETICGLFKQVISTMDKRRIIVMFKNRFYSFWITREYIIICSYVWTVNPFFQTSIYERCIVSINMYTAGNNELVGKYFVLILPGLMVHTHTATSCMFRSTIKLSLFIFSCSSAIPWTNNLHHQNRNLWVYTCI